MLVPSVKMMQSDIGNINYRMKNIMKFFRTTCKIDNKIL